MCSDVTVTIWWNVEQNKVDCLENAVKYHEFFKMKTTVGLMNSHTWYAATINDFNCYKWMMTILY